MRDGDALFHIGHDTAMELSTRNDLTRLFRANLENARPPQFSSRCR